jgi:hypothetical protein
MAQSSCCSCHCLCLDEFALGFISQEKVVKTGGDDTMSQMAFEKEHKTLGKEASQKSAEVSKLDGLGKRDRVEANMRAAKK